MTAQSYLQGINQQKCVVGLFRFRVATFVALMGAKGKLSWLNIKISHTLTAHPKFALSGCIPPKIKCEILTRKG